MRNEPEPENRGVVASLDKVTAICWLRMELVLGADTMGCQGASKTPEMAVQEEPKVFIWLLKIGGRGVWTTLSAVKELKS